MLVTFAEWMSRLREKKHIPPLTASLLQKLNLPEGSPTPFEVWGADVLSGPSVDGLDEMVVKLAIQ